MIIEMKKRKYTLRKRAADREETRSRIIAATIALHEELGPRRTSISAVAERAGVQRLTVYRHFADENALFEACTAGWLADHPPPAVAAANVTTDGVLAALVALYRYFRSTRRMWTVSHRDVDLVPALRAPMEAVAAYLQAYGDALRAPWGRRRQAKALKATTSLAVQFSTWQALDAAGLDDEGMAALTWQWMRAAAEPAGAPARSAAPG